MEFYTVEQAAEILQLEQRTIYKLIKSGALPCVRIGPKIIRITQDNLRAFAEKNAA